MGQLQSGYRFDDGAASAKIEAMAKALAVLSREAELTGRVLTPG